MLVFNASNPRVREIFHPFNFQSSKKMSKLLFLLPLLLIPMINAVNTLDDIEEDSHLLCGDCDSSLDVGGWDDGDWDYDGGIYYDPYPTYGYYHGGGGGGSMTGEQAIIFGGVVGGVIFLCIIIIIIVACISACRRH